MVLPKGNRYEHIGMVYHDFEVMVGTELSVEIPHKLITASRVNNYEAVKKIIDDGNYVSWYRDQALLEAVLAGNVNIVRALVGAGANIRARSDCAMHMAVSIPRLHKMIPVLVSLGADIKFRGQKAIKTALGGDRRYHPSWSIGHMSAWRGRVDWHLMKIIIECGGWDPQYSFVFTDNVHDQLSSDEALSCCCTEIVMGS